MKLFVRNIFIAILLICSFSVKAQSVGTVFDDNDFWFKILSTSPARVGLIRPPDATCYSGDVVIPDTVSCYLDGNDYVVTQILDSAFYECYGITSITIPASIDTIGFYVFKGISGIDTLYINCLGEYAPVLKNTSTHTFYGTYGTPTELNGWRYHVFLSVPCMGIVNYTTGDGWSLVSHISGEYQEVEYYDTICEGSNYYLHNYNLIQPTAGLYSGGQPEGWSCIYVSTLHLAIKPRYNNNMFYYYCDGNSSTHHFNENGIDTYYTGPGYLVYNDTTVGGCDSITTLHFVELGASSQINEEVCQGSPFDYTYQGRLRFELLDVETNVADTMLQLHKIFRPISDTNAKIYYQSGCQQSVTVSVYVNPVLNDTITDTICQGSVFTWQHSGYASDGYPSPSTRYLTSAGFYGDTLYTNKGCNNFQYLNLAIAPVSDTTIYDTICGNETLLFGGQRLSASGTYVASFSNRFGCDSTVRLNLHVYDAYTGLKTSQSRSTIYHSAFNSPSDISAWSIPSTSGNNWRVRNGFLRASANDNSDDYNLYQTSNVTATYTFNSGTYDSIEIMFPFVVNGESSDYLNIRINSTSYRHSGNTNIYRTSGNCYYKYKNTSPNSTQTLRLTWRSNNSGGTNPGPAIDRITINGIRNVQHNHNRTDETVDICQGSSYTFNGHTYSTPGYFLDTLHTVTGGCDSLRWTKLNIHQPYNITIDTALCEGNSLNFCGNTYSANTTTSVLFHDIYGCDSTRNLHLTINPVKQTVIYDTVRTGAPYHFINRTLTQSGTYYDTLQTVFGCDSSIILHLMIYQPRTQHIYDTICQTQVYNRYDFSGQTTTGIYYRTGLFTTVGHADSTAVLHLRVNPVYDDTITASICDHTSYLFGGNPYTLTGIYTDTLHTYRGCDSVSTLNLTVNPVFETTIYDTVRGDMGYNFYNAHYTTSGTYTGVLPNRFGCDSITHLHLQIYPTKTEHIYDTICQTQVYNRYDFSGQTTTGIYYRTGLLTVVGHSDSTAILHLRVNPVYDDTITASICDRTSYLFGGNPYTLTGIYTDSLHTYRGCDSVSTLNLTVNPVFEATIYDTVRGDMGYNFYGTHYTSTGVYTDTLPNRFGCDSITHLHLQIYPTKTEHIYDTICQTQVYNRYDFSGQTTTGIYYRTGLFTVVGHSDSTAILHLCVNPVYDDTITTSICDRTSYLFGGNLYTLTGIYTDSLHTYRGCDSVSTLNLTVNPVFEATIYDTVRGDMGYNFYGTHYTTSGTYTDTLPNRFGCDSITHLHLQIYPTKTEHIYDTICQTQVYNRFDFSGQTTSGTYNRTGLFTVIGHSDSTAILHLWVNPVYDDTITTSICDRTSYLFGGNPYTLTGIYTDSLHTYRGCDSVSSLNLTVNPVFEATIYDTVRGDMGYNFYGTHYTSTGVYTDTLPNRFGCDSITHLHLQIYPTKTEHIYDTICQTQVYNRYDFSGQTTSGTYNRTGLFTVIGHSDSTAILHLWVNPVYDDTITTSICDRTSYLFGGNPYTLTGIYTDSLHTYRGCDSVSSLNLTVNPVFEATIYDTVRGDMGYNFYGTHYDSTGFYTDTLPNRFGCDSITHLHLQIYPTKTEHIYDTICQTQVYNRYDFSGQTTSGTYNRTGLFTVIGHSDSTAILHLWVNPVYDDTLVHHICDRTTYTGFGSHTLFETGYTTDSLHTYRMCDSIVTMHLIVDPVYEVDVYDTVRGDSGYNFYGVMLDTTGLYCDTLSTISGCDSIIHLHLKIYNTATTHLYDTICNTQVYDRYGFQGQTVAGTYQQNLQTYGGADSTVFLHLWVNPVYDDTLVHHICDRTTYYGFGSHELTTGGYYTDSLHTYLMCDSVVTLNLIIDPVYEVTVFDTLRGDEPYNFLGTWVDSTGLYCDTLPSIKGCDSIIHMNLQIYKNAYTSLYDTICDGQVYNDYGFSGLTTAGTYIDSLYTFGGADSVITMHLWVNPVYHVTVYDTICSNQYLLHHGDTLTLAGSYTDTLPTIHGCDSVVTLWLHVFPAYSDTTVAEICDNESYSFRFHENLTEEGSYRDFMTTQNGCDSTFVLLLTVHPTYEITLLDSILTTQNYTFGTRTLYDPGFYTDSLQSQFGCDSIVHLELVHYYPNTTRLHDTICDGQSFFFNNYYCTRDSVYTDTLSAADGTDSLVVLFLHVNPVYHDTLFDSIFCTQQYIFDWDTLSVAGSYTHQFYSQYGCDSTVTLNLYIISTRDLYQTICLNELPYTWNGVTFPYEYLTEPTTFHDSVFVWSDSASRDILLAMHLTVLPNPIQTIADTIVENQLPYNFRGHIYTGNVVADTLLLPSADGCDTTTYYSLYYFPNVSATADTTICYGNMPFVWNGVTFSGAEGIPTFTQSTTLLSHTGSDSLLTMNVHVLQNSYTTRRDTIVENQLPYSVHNHIYFGSSAIDTLIIPNSVGCDSVIYFRLTVFNNNVTQLDTTLCDHLLPLNWHNVNFDDIGTDDLVDTTVLTNSRGADSLLILRVHILRCSTHIFDTTLCSSQLPARWHNRTFNVPAEMPTIIRDTLRYYTDSGADSIIILRMHVNETFNLERFDTICANQPYIFQGTAFNASTTLYANLQSVAGCDSNVVIHLKAWPTETSMFDDVVCEGTPYSWIDGHIYEEPVFGPSATLRTIHGCDSTVYLNLYQGEKAVAKISSSHIFVPVGDNVVHLIDGTEHSASRVWRFPDSLSTRKSLDYIYPIDYDSVRVWLMVVNDDGCKDTTSIMLKLDRDFIYAPNAFCPTCETNNRFTIGMEGVLTMKVTLFTRAGQKVYEWEGLDGYWDGHKDGEVLPQGAYTYLIEYTTERHSRQKQKKVGTVILMR